MQPASSVARVSIEAIIGAIGGFRCRGPENSARVNGKNRRVYEFALGRHEGHPIVKTQLQQSPKNRNKHVYTTVLTGILPE